MFSHFQMALMPNDILHYFEIGACPQKLWPQVVLIYNFLKMYLKAENLASYTSVMKD